MQVLVNFLNFTVERMDLSGLTLRRLAVDNDGTAKFDLTLYVAEAGGELIITANYNTDLFAAATITRMLRHLQTLLDGVIANPGQRLSALPLLMAAERRHLVTQQQRVRPTNPFVVFPKEEIEQSLAGRFVQQVQCSPYNIAIKTKYDVWTYEVLNRMANDVAQILLRHEETYALVRSKLRIQLGRDLLVEILLRNRREITEEKLSDERPHIPGLQEPRHKALRKLLNLLLLLRGDLCLVLCRDWWGF